MPVSRAVKKFWALLTVGLTSSTIMLWSIWHYPLSTGIAAAVVLAAFGVSAALTRAVDIDVRADQPTGGHGA